MQQRYHLFPGRPKEGPHGGPTIFGFPGFLAPWPRPKKNNCLFLATRPSLSVSADPKHFIKFPQKMLVWFASRYSLSVHISILDYYWILKVKILLDKWLYNL